MTGSFRKLLFRTAKFCPVDTELVKNCLVYQSQSTIVSKPYMWYCSQSNET